MLRNNVHSKVIHLNSDFDKDLNWFRLFLNQFNAVRFYDNRLISDVIYMDTSLTASYGNMVYHIPVPLDYPHFNIVQLEKLNIVVALRSADICGGIRSKFTVIMVHCG